MMKKMVSVLNGVYNPYKLILLPLIYRVLLKIIRLNSHRLTGNGLRA